MGIPASCQPLHGLLPCRPLAVQTNSDIAFGNCAELPTLAIARVTVLLFTLQLRDLDHLKYVRAQPCLACGRSPADAHHLKFAQQRALGRKVSDEFCVPLCRTHHRELHLRGDERKWWQHHNVDPLKTAHRLWQHTRSKSDRFDKWSRGLNALAIWLPSPNDIELPRQQQSTAWISTIASSQRSNDHRTLTKAPQTAARTAATRT